MKMGAVVVNSYGDGDDALAECELGIAGMCFP
jgi:hypothetical protein